MEKEIKLIAMDIDGTIFGEDKSLHEETKKMIEKAASQGLQMVIATGRALEAVPKEILELSGLTYISTSNGSSIFTLPDLKRIYNKCLNDIQFQTMLTFYEKYHCPLEVFVDGGAYAPDYYVRSPENYGVSGRGIDYVQSTRHPVKDSLAFILDHKTSIEGANFIVTDPELKKRMMTELRAENCLYVTSSVPRYVEISHIDVCKRSALRWLTEELGLNRENVMAFGDGNNDIEMIEYAGVGVAMENGMDALKKAADQIAPPCEKNGVAQFLSKFFCLN